MTGLPSALRQPLRFQPGIHFVMQLITYWLSQSTSSSSSRCCVARKSSSTAFSSAWLFVACGQPPAAQLSSSTYHAQPAGPGFPRAEPSAAAVITVSFRVGLVRRPSYRAQPTAAVRRQRTEAAASEAARRLVG